LLLSLKSHKRTQRDTWETEALWQNVLGALVVAGLVAARPSVLGGNSVGWRYLRLALVGGTKARVEVGVVDTGWVVVRVADLRSHGKR
jgi:hypothetical protein